MTEIYGKWCWSQIDSIPIDISHSVEFVRIDPCWETGTYIIIYPVSNKTSFLSHRESQTGAPRAMGSTIIDVN